MFTRTPGGLRVLTLNLAHGRGTAFHQALTPRARIEANLDAVAAVLRAANADVVALQELDAPSSWSGRFCHLERLAAAAGYAHSYHGIHLALRAPRLAYGTGVLSRWPIAGAESRRFAKNALDTKGFVLARVDVPGGPLDLVSVHLDFKRDRERRAQLEDVSAHLAARPDPAPHLVVAGDFNCAPLGGPDAPDGDEEPPEPEVDPAEEVRRAARGDACALRSFARRHDLVIPAGTATFPARRPRRQLDHVLVSPSLDVQRLLVVPHVVSDHLAVLLDASVRVAS